MHEVVPRVVAMAVRMVASKWMIFCMISFLVMVLGVLSYEWWVDDGTQMTLSGLMNADFFYFCNCHSEERSDEDVLLRACPKISSTRSSPPPYEGG